MNSDLEQQNTSSEKQDDSPPIFKSWSGWYSVVLGFLLIELILFYIIAKVF